MRRGREDEAAKRARQVSVAGIGQTETRPRAARDHRFRRFLTDACSRCSLVSLSRRRRRVTHQFEKSLQPQCRITLPRFAAERAIRLARPRLRLARCDSAIVSPFDSHPA